ncbi:hypothetical protein KSC_025610 [Ktedonobacter sp. SOSP1-52]|nr:hypothetical protein KSC_025610 [Ktedonobacter sp. SOSP1-52]
MQAAHRMVAHTFRQEADRILASLISTIRDFELAEDALQDALLIALERWPVEGIPSNPGAWITTTARRKAIDRLRRASTLARKHEILQELLQKVEQQGTEAGEDRSIPDERLKLMFTCCHPTLALEAQVALTLQTLGGLSTAEIASAFGNLAAPVRGRGFHDSGRSPPSQSRSARGKHPARSVSSPTSSTPP